MTKFGLSGNSLKIIAMITMFCDHLGMIFFPHLSIFRIVGRVAFPIYAYLIAEGCKHTHNRKKYFLQIFLLGIAFSIVFIIVERYIYLCVLITFSMSILMIYLVDYIKYSLQTRFILFPLGLIFIWIFCSLIEVDYGFFGVLVPIMVYISDKRIVKNILFMLSLIVLSINVNNGMQIYGLISVLLVAFYNGERGKLNLKRFFYLFYPLHLALLWSVYIIIYINVWKTLVKKGTLKYEYTYTWFFKPIWKV